MAIERVREEGSHVIHRFNEVLMVHILGGHYSQHVMLNVNIHNAGIFSYLSWCIKGSCCYIEHSKC